MATLVLAVAGNKIGGQFGQAVGAAIGQRIDQRLFGPKGRQGPRLGDLAVQSSIYGAPIPKLYGTNRVAWMPSPAATSATHLEMFVFLGEWRCRGPCKAVCEACA